MRNDAHFISANRASLRGVPARIPGLAAES
jgi:hypothetical protein